MTAKEMKLAAYFLDMAADQFNNHGCNDMPAEALEASGFTIGEGRDFAEDCAMWGNAEDKEHVAHMRERGLIGVQDWEAMHTLAFKLRSEAKRGRVKP
jgi:hypothetical protein